MTECIHHIETMKLPQARGGGGGVALGAKAQFTSVRGAKEVNYIPRSVFGYVYDDTAQHQHDTVVHPPLTPAQPNSRLQRTPLKEKGNRDFIREQAGDARRYTPISLPPVEPSHHLRDVLIDLWTTVMELSESFDDGAVCYVPIIGIKFSPTPLPFSMGGMHGGVLGSFEVTVAVTNAYHLQDAPDIVTAQNPNLAKELESKVPRVRRRMMPYYSQRITDILNSNPSLHAYLDDFVKKVEQMHKGSFTKTDLFNEAYLIFLCHSFYRLAEAEYKGSLTATVTYNQSSTFTVSLQEGKAYIQKGSDLAQAIEEPFIPMLDLLRIPNILIEGSREPTVNPTMSITGLPASEHNILSVETFRTMYWGHITTKEVPPESTIHVCEDIVISSHQRQRKRMDTQKGIELPTHRDRKRMYDLLPQSQPQPSPLPLNANDVISNLVTFS